MIAEESVIISQEDNDYLQFLNYEANSYKSILENILICKNPKYQYSVETYTHFMNEYKEASMKLDLAVQEVLEKYNCQKYIGNSNYQYSFDFYYNKVEFYKVESRNHIKGCGSCGK